MYNSDEDRNKEIYSLRKNGESLKSLSEKFGICVERIRQICKKQEFFALKSIRNNEQFGPFVIKNTDFLIGEDGKCANKTTFVLCH